MFTAMDLKSDLLVFASKATEIKEKCKNEQSTKQSLILPFLQILGYDIFNPSEVEPEVVCDIKNSVDKIDYVIHIDGKQQILIECKHCNKNLDGFVNQLRGYFVASEARIGILTNGLEYRFYTDLDNANLMDESPFMTFSLNNITEESIENLRHFVRSAFDIKSILNKAFYIRFSSRLKTVINEELTNPSNELLHYFCKKVLGYNATQQMKSRLFPLIVDMLLECTTNESNSTELEKKDDENNPVLSVVREILKDYVKPERIQCYNGIAYSTIRLDDIKWFPIIKYRFSENTKWVSIGRYNIQTVHLGCDISLKKQISDVSDVWQFAKDIRDVVTVMLIDGDGVDDLRCNWVVKNRPDWCEE